MPRASLGGIFVLTLACAPASPVDAPASSTAEAPAPAPKPAPELGSSEPQTDPAVHITASDAEAAGFPPLGFSLDTTDTGLSGSRFGADYLTLSGPPGGPLILRFAPASTGAELPSLLTDMAGGASLVAESIELLGETRPAAAWITGESLARTSWCATVLSPPNSEPGAPALLLIAGVGHQTEATTCATALANPTIAAALASFAWD